MQTSKLIGHFILRQLPAVFVVTMTLALSVGCAGNDSSQHEPSRPPAPDLARVPNVSWQVYQSVELPFSREDGPANTYDVVPHGYAHTPQGALLAGLQAEARLSLAPDQSWPAIVNTLVAPGAGRDRFAAARAAVSITASPEPQQAPSYAGYRWDSYTDGEARVQVAVRQNGQLASKSLTLRWIRGYEDNPDDWKLLLPVDGIGAPLTPTESLEHFTRFGSPS